MVKRPVHDVQMPLVRVWQEGETLVVFNEVNQAEHYVPVDSKQSFMKSGAIKARAAAVKNDHDLRYEELSSVERAAIRVWLVKQQNYRCVHCGVNLAGEPADEVLERPIEYKAFPKASLKYPIHLHHDHDSGVMIGAVHAYCNGDLYTSFGE